MDEEFSRRFMRTIEGFVVMVTDRSVCLTTSLIVIIPCLFSCCSQTVFIGHFDSNQQRSRCRNGLILLCVRVLCRLPGIIYIGVLSLADTHRLIAESFALVNSSLSEGVCTAVLEVSYRKMLCWQLMWINACLVFQHLILSFFTHPVKSILIKLLMVLLLILWFLAKHCTLSLAVAMFYVIKLYKSTITYCNSSVSV